MTPDEMTVWWNDSCRNVCRQNNCTQNGHTQNNYWLNNCSQNDS